MIAKTLPEISCYIESRIRALSRENNIDWLEALSLYCSQINERVAIVERVLRCEERPTTKLLQSLIGHMDISSIYEKTDVKQCPKCGSINKEYLYVVKKQFTPSD